MMNFLIGFRFESFGLDGLLWVFFMDVLGIYFDIFGFGFYVSLIIVRDDIYSDDEDGDNFLFGMGGRLYE